MSFSEEVASIQTAYASGRLSRRALFRRAAALGCSAVVAAAIEKGALAAPAPTWADRVLVTHADKATTLIVAVEGDVDTFDPAFTASSTTAQTVIQNTFDQLTQYQVVDKTLPDGSAYTTVDTEHIVGMLAADAKTDGANLVFTLRDGLTYANGDPIDANVILQGYQRIYETKGVSSFLLAMGGGVTGADAFSAPDAKTFVIKQSRPNVLIQKNNVMHNTSALNPKEIAAHKTDADPWATSWFKQHLGIGNGPYQLDSYKAGDSITLTANDSYYGTKPSFTTVVLKIVPDPTQRVQLLTKGDVDFATLLPVKDFDSLKANTEIKTLSVPSTHLTMLELNATIPPFDNPRVRQAVAQVIPHQAIIDQIFKGQAGPAKSIIPSGMPTSDFSSYPYEENLDKAKAALVAAGFANGAGLPAIKLTVQVGNDPFEQIAILVQDALRKIAVNATIEKLGFGPFNETEQAGKLQAWIADFLSWVHDPFYQFSWTTQSASPVNYPRFKSDRVDQLIEQYTLADAGPDRDAASKEVQSIVNEAANYIYLAQPNWTVFTRADIEGYVYYNDELPRFSQFKRTGG
jgi:peptide/nickel transport system substrate-binding protein